jgi:hypothetical protein
MTHADLRRAGRAVILGGRMNQTYLSMFFGQMLTQAPVLLVYVVGIVLCAVWWRRAPQAAMLALIGLAIMLMTTLGFSFFQGYVLRTRVTTAQAAAAYQQTMMWLSIGASIIRAAGMGMVIAGVFVGRAQVAVRRGGGFEVHPFDPQQPPPMMR